MFSGTCADFAVHGGNLGLGALGMRCYSVDLGRRTKTLQTQRTGMPCCQQSNFAMLTASFSSCYYIRNLDPLIYLRLQLAVIIQVFLRYIKLCGVVREAVTVADVR